MIRQGSLLAVVFAVGSMAGVARAVGPTKDQCFDASETGQLARKAGRLLNARDHLRICVATPCPEVVRTDCATRLKEVDVAIPTVVFKVNENGVGVSIDGADPIDIPTKPIELDAGNHGFAFSQGGKTVRRIVTLKEGQKDEPVTVVFEAPGDRDKALAPETPPTAPPDRSLSYIAFGVAGVGLVGGIVTGLIAGAKHATLAGQCNDATGTCVPSARDDLDAFHTWRTISTAGYVLGAIGVVSGIALWLATPSLPGDRAATLSLFPSAAGLGGRF